MVSVLLWATLVIVAVAGGVTINGQNCSMGNVVVESEGCTPLDPEGAVCANDGTANEAFCSYEVGSSACARCSLPASPSGCSTGKYQAHGTSSCQLCDVGTYQDETNASTCKSCEAGLTSPNGSESSSSCVAHFSVPCPTCSILLPRLAMAAPLQSGAQFVCGRVEYPWDPYNPEASYHSVCGRPWDRENAVVACRDIGLDLYSTPATARALSAWSLNITRPEHQLRPLGLGFRCEGGEVMLSQCPGTVGFDAASNCTAADDAGVCCELATLSCGEYDAVSCLECVWDHSGHFLGSSSCGGDCMWDAVRSMCVDPTAPSVDWTFGNITDTADSCDTVCERRGGVCEQSYLEHLNVAHSSGPLLVAFGTAGLDCSALTRNCEGSDTCQEWGSPYRHSTGSACFAGLPIASCSQVPADNQHRRLCPCSAQPETASAAPANSTPPPTTNASLPALASTTPAPAWYNISFNCTRWVVVQSMNRYTNLPWIYQIEADAQHKFDEFVGGLYAAILFDHTLEILQTYGNTWTIENCGESMRGTAAIALSAPCSSSTPIQTTSTPVSQSSSSSTPIQTTSTPVSQSSSSLMATPTSTPVKPRECEAGYTGDGGDCTPCPADRYKASIGSEACEPCPSRSQAAIGSAVCNCISSFKRKNSSDVTQGCFIRQTRPSDGDVVLREFLVQINLSAELNQSLGVPAIQQAIADFFSISEVDVTVVETNRRAVIYSAVEAIVYRDQPEFVKDLADTTLLLQEYLNSLEGRRRSGSAFFQVLSMQATCGRGYTTRSGPNPSNADSNACIPCGLGEYKSALDNSACVPCAARHASTNVTGAIAASFCYCAEGHTAANISDTSNYTLTCVNYQQYVSVENAKGVSRAISAAVGTVVAANVAVGVATAVASSVSSAVAASSGATVGGATAGSGGAASGSSSACSSSGGTLTLISQVQFLNQVGRVGGTQASPSISEFSGGFGWSNFEWSMFENNSSAVATNRRGLRWRWNRRTPKAKNKDSSNAAIVPAAGSESASGSGCSFQDITPPAMTIMMCVVILCLVSCARYLTGLVLVRCFRRELPNTLLFPSWEGPVVLVQYLALCDKSISAASLLCPAGISLGVLVLLMGPIAFLVLAARYIRGGMRDGDLHFEASPSPSLKVFRRKISAAKGLVGKAVTAHAYFGASFARGEWKDSKSQAYWGFLTSSFVGPFWFYALWVLGKKLWLAAILNLLDGPANAALALASQGIDTGLLLYMRPYADRRTDVTESLGGITNLLSFMALSLPVIMGPDVELPGFLGDFTSLILASAATILASAMSLTAPISVALGLVIKVLASLGCCFKSSIAGTAFGESRKNVIGNLQDEVQGEVEAKYDPGDDEEEDVDGGTLSLAGGAALSCGGVLGSTGALGSCNALDDQSRRFVVLVCDYGTVALRAEQLRRFVDYFYPAKGSEKDAVDSISSTEEGLAASWDGEPLKLSPDPVIRSSLVPLEPVDQQIAPGVYRQAVKAPRHLKKDASTTNKS